MEEIDKPLLSEKDVRAAEKREGDYTKHPVILALDRHQTKIARFIEGYFEIKDGQLGETRTKGGYLRSSSGFLIEAITEASPYTLQPLELVAIWSRVLELFPDGPGDMGYSLRYSLAGIISTVYAVSGSVNAEWLDFPRTYLRDLGLPAEVLQDRDGALRVFHRLEEVRLNFLEIGCYARGSRMDFGSLINRALNGDSEAENELKSSIKREGPENRNTPVLSEIGENFGNGMMYAHSLVGRLLRTE